MTIEYINSSSNQTPLGNLEAGNWFTRLRPQSSPILFRKGQTDKADIVDCIQISSTSCYPCSFTAYELVYPIEIVEFQINAKFRS